MKPFFITTAIDYTNGAPHIGHAYEKVLADVLARFHRQIGEEVFLLTGVDQHGQKVQQSAEREGIAPQQYVDEVTARFLALWQKLGIRFDGWAATTAQRHKDCVRAVLNRLWEDKDPSTGSSRWIYKAARSGHYSVRQEQFLTDKERGPDGEFGPEWGQVEFREEENYYFRLAEHRQWLLDLIEARGAGGRPFVQPEFRVAELRNAVEKLEGDLCISRPKSRLSWGIEFPFDPEFVTYVWFDALVNYISFAPGYDPHSERPPQEFLRWWRTVVHDIGKDILIPAHGVYWPVMLKALGFTDSEMPTLLVHGWWNISGAKMSKSLGNTIDPDTLADRYGPTALRYYLMSDITTGRDADFSEERLVQRYNVDLANGLGNLVNRSLNMTRKYREGSPNRVEIPDDLMTHLTLNSTALADYALAMREGQVQAALERLGDVVNRANALVDAAAPWKLAKDPDQAERLDAVLTSLIFSARTAATMLLPLLPDAAAEILRQLALEPVALSGGNETNPADLPEGYRCGEPQPVFPRLELTAPPAQ
jgi:methionyl-tRNA synthetase